MTGHRELRERLGAYALGQLDGAPWQAVHDHLEVCAACRAELEEIAPVAGLLGSTRERVRPEEIGAAAVEPPPFPVGLLTEVRTDAVVVPIARRRLPRRLATAAAVAVGLLAAGAIGYTTGGAGRPAPVPSEAIAVRAVDPAVQARADVVAHTWGMELKITATGFRAGEPYSVTVTDDAGRVVGAGAFVGTGAEEMRCNLTTSVPRADASTVQVLGPDGTLVLDAAV